MRLRKVTILLIGAIIISFSSVLAQTIQERFEGEGKLSYKVYFNGVSVGRIEWEYLGQEFVEECKVDVIYVDSDTKILKLLNLESKEKVFLDSKTHLPLKVERDIVFFGKKELIVETYNQEEGYVKISKGSSKGKEKFLYQDKPIHNILALLYFFPKDISLKKNVWMDFNLPTQKIKIKLVEERILVTGNEKKNTYFLIGIGANRFSLWLDKESRLPRRLEFILPAGKITIVRKIEN